MQVSKLLKFMSNAAGEKDETAKPETIVNVGNLTKYFNLLGGNEVGFYITISVISLSINISLSFHYINLVTFCYFSITKKISANIRNKHIK